MDINDDIMNMPRGWVVHYEDGTIITEYDIDGNAKDWRAIPKKGIKSVSLKWHNKHWTISGKDCYIQFKRAWVAPMAGNITPNIDYRCIGYWEGNDKVIYKVNEKTGQMQMLVESIDNK